MNVTFRALKFSAHCGSTATGRHEFGHHDQIQSCPSIEGEAMIVDLESWEAGYDDGLVGRPSQCTQGLDQVSYSSGYFQARACRAETQETPRYALSSTQRAAQRRGGSARLIII
jgi:hypothetical protein